jgi:PAS domain S-box-containing protein
MPKRIVGRNIDITGYELQELRRREAYLAEAQRLSHTGSFGWRPDTGEIVWSDETYRIFEYDRSVKPTIDSLVQRVHPEDCIGVKEVINRSLEGEPEFEHAYRLLLPDGRVKHVHAIAHVLQDASGNREFVGAVTDITERKTTEDKIRRLVDANILGIFIGNFEGAIIEANDAFLRMVEYSREDVVSGRLRSTDLTPPEWRQRDERAVAEMKATGMVQPYEKEYFRKDGSRVSVMIGSALFEGGNEGVVFVLDLSEQKRAQEARRSSEAYLAEAQRLAHMGSWAWSPDQGTRYCSEECYRVLGFDPRDGLPRFEDFFQRIHPDDQPGFRELIQTAIRQKAEWVADYRLVHPGGAIRDMHVVCHPVLSTSGHLVEFVGSVIDVTERKRAEDEQRRAEAVIREQEAELRQVVDTIPAIVWSTLPDGSNTYVNKRFVEYSGSSGEHMAGSGWKALIHPDDLERHVDKWMEAVATGKPLENEVRSRRSDGQYRWQLDRGVPLRDKDGNIVKWYGVTTDIEDRKRAEEALGVLSRDLQENKAKLEEAQRVAHVGYWEWDLRTDHVTWSDETYRIYGLHPQKCPMELATIRESIHPEDREFVFRKRAEAIQGEVRVDAEHRIVRPNGEVRVVHSQGDLKRDAAGLPWQMFGTVQDITDRKLAEDKIREQEAGLRQILDLAPQHIAVYGPNREPLYANRILLDYCGLTLEKWRQRLNRSGVAHPDEWERVNRHFDRALASGSAFELEMRLRKSDGSYRWFLARYNPLRDEQGQIMRWYVAATDIEDRKQAEDRLRSENVALREEIDKASMFEEIVGTSPALKAVLSRISKVAPSGSTVLITGETGTGKELVARAIHRISDRALRAFVSVNCAAIPRDLIASELFGHEKGAFTGATQQRLGRFELANGGTLFLDEVGELPAETQIALLRVLQEHEFERVGGTRRIRADVRVIAATNRDLQAAIISGSFRSDLFYRLNVFPIEIPSLRERREDIPMLVEYFIDRYARKGSKQIKRINKKTLELLQSYSWPGNIRELQNVIERSVILCETEIFSIDENWLPPPLTLESKQQVGLRRRFLLQEKDMIESALKDTGGRVAGPAGAAVKLGMPRSTMESKIRSFKINKNRFKT